MEHKKPGLYSIWLYARAKEREHYAPLSLAGG